ncbi:hypothetical protein BKA62DRAFT_704774 [Auriculariales sp. MPI-PUGE-AT-0066]|nr:hypothetical protein BKA62DRAFT_704774 [Auriculariales sp. MPI-PUGE-AT-0066]
MDATRRLPPLPPSPTPSSRLTAQRAPLALNHNDCRVPLSVFMSNCGVCCTGLDVLAPDADLIEIDLGEKGRNSGALAISTQRHVIFGRDPDTNLNVLQDARLESGELDNKTRLRVGLTYLCIWAVIFVAWGVFSWHFVRACFWPIPAVGLGASSTVFAISIGILLALIITMFLSIGYGIRHLLPQVLPQLAQKNMQPPCNVKKYRRMPIIIALLVGSILATVFYLAFTAATLGHPYSAACDIDMPVTAFVTANRNNSGTVVMYETDGDSTWSTTAHLSTFLREIQFSGNDTLNATATTTLPQLLVNPTLDQDSSTTSTTSTGTTTNRTAVGLSEANAQTFTFTTANGTTYSLEWSGQWPKFSFSTTLDVNSAGVTIVHGATLAPTSCRTVKVCARSSDGDGVTELLYRVYMAQVQWAVQRC